MYQRRFKGNIRKVRIINSISDRQNELDLLQTQFCARHLYDVATVLNYITWGLCIASSMVLPLISNTIGAYSIIIIAIISVANLAVGFKSERFVKLGAAYKMRFDYKLYQFEECNDYQGITLKKLKQIAVKIIQRYPKSYEEAIMHNGTDKPKGVKDWYVGISKELSQEEAIKKCQEQNGFFDKEIMKIAWWVFIGIIGVSIILIGIFCREKTVESIALFVLSCSALIILIIKEIYRFVQAYSTYYFMDRVNEESDIPAKIRQKVIDDRRKLNLITPNIIYHFKTYKLHSLLKAEEHTQI